MIILMLFLFFSSPSSDNTAALVYKETGLESIEQCEALASFAEAQFVTLLEPVVKHKSDFECIVEGEDKTFGL